MKLGYNVIFLGGGDLSCSHPWWRATHGPSSRAPRQPKKSLHPFTSQGNGPSFSTSTTRIIRVLALAQARFCLSLGGRFKWGNFLHALPPSCLGPQLSNKTSCSPIGGHLVSQPSQKPQLCSTGPNPAQSTFEAWMGTLLSSIRSEILGHENALKYLSSQGFKGELKDQHG